VFDVQQGLAIGLFHPTDNPQRKNLPFGQMYVLFGSSVMDLLQTFSKSMKGHKEEDDFQFTPPMHDDLPRAVVLQGDVAYKRGKTSQGEAEAAVHVRAKHHLR